MFRPYRSLSPYIQFVGRILRLANPFGAGSIANKVYVVSHVGMNDERWWSDFKNFDREDQALFTEIFEGADTSIEGSHSTPRLTLRPFMRVLNETVEKYVRQTYLSEIDDTMVTDFMETIRSKGFDPIEFGITEDMVRTRLQFSAAQQKDVTALSLPVQPQRQKEALRVRLTQEARSIADVVINRLELQHAGRDLISRYPGRGTSNSAILITLAQKAQNEVMGVDSGARDSASLEQFRLALDATANIADKLTGTCRPKKPD